MTLVSSRKQPIMVPRASSATPSSSVPCHLHRPRGSAVGGGLNFHITRVVFAVISRKLANAQEAFQTYLRSRNVEHIYVATYGAGPWDGRFYDGFKAVTPSGS